MFYCYTRQVWRRARFSWQGDVTDKTQHPNWNTWGHSAFQGNLVQLTSGNLKIVLLGLNFMSRPSKRTWKHPDVENDRFMWNQLLCLSYTYILNFLHLSLWFLPLMWLSSYVWLSVQITVTSWLQQKGIEHTFPYQCTQHNSFSFLLGALLIHFPLYLIHVNKQYLAIPCCFCFHAKWHVRLDWKHTLYQFYRFGIGKDPN